MIYRFGDFTLDGKLFELRRNSERIAVERRVLDLILYLVLHRSRIVTRKEIGELLWPEVVVDRKRSVDQALYMARKVLGDRDASPRLISTIRGRGVRFTGAVSEIESRLELRSKTEFVGRAAELATVLGILPDSVDEGGSAVLVFGEAGIGKTCLMDVACSEAAKRGFRVLKVRCSAPSSGVDYWPWIQAIRERGGDSEESRRVLSLAPTPLRRWLGVTLDASENRSIGADCDPGLLVSDWLHRFLCGLMVGSPLLLAIDDLHWSDRSSLRCLSYLAATFSQEPASFICTVRSPIRGHHTTCPDDLATCLAAVQRHTRSSSIELGGLSRSAIKALAKEWVKPTALAVAAGELRKRTSGNPLYVRQLLPYLDPVSGSLSNQLPQTLLGTVSATLSDLPAGVRASLEASCVLAEPFGAEVVAGIIGGSLSTVVSSLGVAVEAGVLVPAEPIGFRFSHAVLRDAVYQNIDGHRRARLHLAAARFLAESAIGSIGEIARHLVRAVPAGSRESAIDSSVKAARAAANQCAYDEAVDHFAASLSLLEEGRRRRSLSLEMGEVLIRSGRRDEGRAVVLSALRGGLAGVDVADVALRLAPGFFAMEVGAQDVFVEELLRRSLSDDATEGGKRGVLLQARLATALYWCRDKDTERASLAKSVRGYLAGRASWDPVEAWAETFLLLAEWTPDTLADRLEAAARLAEAGHPSLECRLVNYVIWSASLIEAGRLEALEALGQRFGQLVGEAGIRQAEWYVTLIAGMLAVERGSLGTAFSLADRMLSEGCRAGDKNAFAGFSALRAMCHFHQRPDIDLACSLEKMVARFPGVEAWETALGVVLHRAGEKGRAAEVYDRRIQSIHSMRSDMMLLPSLAHLGELATEMKDQEGARQVLGALSPYEGRRVAVGYCVTTWGSIDRILGKLHLLLGRPWIAESCFRQAVRSDLASRSWIWLAYSYLDLAELLAEHSEGRRAEGCEVARRALDLARRAGQEWVATRASSVLGWLNREKDGALETSAQAAVLGD